ncbi:hypothetical protein AB0K14_23730 [Actinosynnema sp. NPDC050801]|uniref:hypothetical protein n=1 Tax=unclassified Actinosynnema TaxID=2637065 RepID=UPI003403BFA5
MLLFHVEDQTHHRVRNFTDDSANSFLGVARRCAANGSRVMDVIDPYTDTMLNFIQLDRLIGELGALLASGELVGPERDLLAAAKEARGLSGYLFIVGD